MLYLPCNIPCAAILRREGFGIAEVPLHHRQEGAKLVLLLNLMPEKAACELQIARMIAPVAEEIDIQVVPVKIPGQTYKTTPIEHLLSFYEDISPATFGNFSHPLLIVTGAPLENVAYEDVRYWAELCEIFRWASSPAVERTLNLCWAAFAALYYIYGVPTHHLEEKRFGVYPHQQPDGSLMPIPISRHIELHREDLLPHAELRIVADSSECGPGILIDEARRMTHITGHLEYEAERLHFEYERDMSRGKPIHPACCYYENNVPAPENIRFSWHDVALLFYKKFLLGGPVNSLGAI